MDLPSKKVYGILGSKGVDTLYHANSVLTSCHFLRDNHLSSRGTVDSYGIPQTSQYSDPHDKKYSVWFDVFTDSADIHNRSGSRNKYGPVLFVLDPEKLSKEIAGKIWVTKKNPTKWSGLPIEDRWFQSIVELESGFRLGTFDQMVVFRHCGGRLPIKRALKEIVLDDPCMTCPSSGAEFFSVAYGALTLAMTEGDIDVPISKRQCAQNCSCSSAYRSLSLTKRMFNPRL